MFDILPFRVELDTVAIAGACLWALALYLSFSQVREWVTTQLNRWFNFAEQSLYTSQSEFEKTRKAREAQNSFYASLFSIFPFLIFGGLSNWILDISLGNSWGISIGILACMGAGVYELGRRQGEE
ncbi:hypothetical protein VB638_05260 [Dolichospermum sp. UHCC 0684]|jgi:hypothetical protein|uniref:Uncharacterized protein n=1 Tax=Dolichospermum flos-aquae CCAP 1403/13F TaxID=315271 RepID=A0A6H2BZ88_DOLFA|nr:MULTISPECIES: hypothetical protein [Nostocales]MBJ7297039.1 hypothetical protein [Dolichospermum sp.]MBO1046406.1 hypothetical protein [Dolichospermum sp. DEX182a]MBO1052135.1 hypothetical protein [Dolichospermum sp. DET73]MBS9384813.1 hypothetical protein [Dolichospermum sp. BR01]MCE2699131.1 hypothetical protein [Anabaena sp. 49633_E8]MDJ0501912.1 hypothetical protein [Nostocales cyanobacterium LE14-WE4]OBQ08594.1 MAG: hypothetical protein AN482_12695 [Anabaena sp. LE011-02]